MGVHRLSRRYDFTVRSIHVPIADIVLYRALENKIFLCHHPHLPPQAFHGYLLDVVAVDEDPPLLDVVKAAD